MKTGRNDPCRCRSGKKYKKCCMAADLTAEQSRPAKLLRSAADDWEVVEEKSADAVLRRPAPLKQPARPDPTPEPLDPKMEAINARWEEFDEATEDVRRELYFKTLDDPELMDDEMAFEMLSRLYASTVKSDERDVWQNMVEQLRTRLPDVYETGRKYYLGWQITNAIASGRRAPVKLLALEMAKLAGDDVDLYSNVVDQLAYHGMLDELSEASRIAWPLINDSGNIMWGQSNFAAWGADCVLFERLEQTGKLSHEDSELMNRLNYYYHDLQLERFSEYVKSISGQSDRTWSLDDFEVSPNRRQKRTYDDDEYVQGLTSESKSALSGLLDNFVDYARRVEGVQYTKAKLAVANIYSYIVERVKGKLEPRQSMLESITNPQQKTQPKPQPPVHVLCPDRNTLDRHFAGLLHFMNPQYYDVAATMELIPAWLRFLESKGLLETDLRESTLKELNELRATLLKLFQSDRSDPALAANLASWNAAAH